MKSLTLPQNPNPEKEGFRKCCREKVENAGNQHLPLSPPVFCPI